MVGSYEVQGTYPFPTVEDFQHEGEGSTGNERGSKVHHVVVHHGKLYKVLSQRVLLCCNLRRH